MKVLNMLICVLFIAFMTYCFIAGNTAGVCFAGFMLMNTRFNEMDRW